MSSNTVFEKIINREILGFFLFENKDCIAILDVFPLRDGHTLVIPTKPHTHIQDMTSNELKELMNGVKQAQEMLGQHFDTEDFTVAIHDGPLAGQEIPHVHIHVIPRQQGDGGGSLPLMWPNRERFTSPPLKSLEALHESLTKT
ncbi:MAG: HIT family protein [Candidatus Thermoplasmatota archaeon]|nr:HIT family protein [Euryarchaeota archaeon]MED5350389.1 HIT family protein [Candidatus Thermoplasmatota archaeon]